MNHGFFCSLTGLLLLVELAGAQPAAPETTAVPAEAAPAPATDQEPPRPPSNERPAVVPVAGTQVAVPNTLPPPTMLPPIMQNQPGAMPPESPTEPLRAPTPITEPPAEPLPAAPARVPGQFWASLEYLMWFANRQQLSTDLLTTGAATASPPPGVLLGATTQVLVGADDLKFNTYSGVRFAAGYWFTDSRLIGVEFSALYVNPYDLALNWPSTATATGVLSRPFINAQTGRPGVVGVAFPGNFNGFVSVAADSWLTGGELNLVGKFFQQEHGRWDVLVGGRYLRLRETLDIFDSSSVLRGGVIGFQGVAVPSGSVVRVLDHFGTKNEFEGFQIGIRKTHELGNLTVACLAKLGVGMTRQTIDINGFTTVNNTQGVAAGVYALPSNSGIFRNDQLSVLPQLQLNLTYHCTENCHIFLNYDILAWSGVVRPGEQIDPVINLTQLPVSGSFGPLVGPLRPLVPFQERLFWVQGIGIGMEMRY